MDFDSFLSTPRWRILELLAQQPSSPLELSHQLETSVSYVSQQLKLLEAAGLVIKKRTGRVDPGKPRSVYSLANELSYLSILADGWAGKKLLYLTENHKRLLRIWMVDDPALHYPLEKFYWHVEQLLSDIEGIFFRVRKGANEVVVLSPSKRVKAKIDSFENGSADRFSVLLLSREAFLKQLDGESTTALYDPDCLLRSNGREMKGGDTYGKE